MNVHAESSLKSLEAATKLSHKHMYMHKSAPMFAVYSSVCLCMLELGRPPVLNGSADRGQP